MSAGASVGTHVQDGDDRPDLAAVARSSGLAVVGLRPSLPSYVVQLFRRRDFVVTMARSGVSAGQARDYLGALWLILTPLLLGVVYLFVFGYLLQTSRGVPSFIGFLVVGIFVYQYLARMITEGAKAVQGNIRLVQALAFPRAALPLAVGVKAAITFLPAIGVMLVIVVVDPGFQGFSWYWLLVVPALLLATLFGLGLVFLMARLTTQINDINNLLPFVLRVLLYTSGVFYSFDRFDSVPRLQAVLQENPVYIYLTLTRDAVVYGEASPEGLWWRAAAWALGACVIGFVVFWQAEETYTRD